MNKFRFGKESSNLLIACLSCGEGVSLLVRSNVGIFIVLIRFGSKRYAASARTWRIDDSMVAIRPGHDGFVFIATTSLGEIITISWRKVTRACSRSLVSIILFILSATAVWSRSCKGGSYRTSLEILSM